MRNKFELPEMKITLFQCEDVIMSSVGTTTSPDPTTPGTVVDGGGDPDAWD